MPYLDTDVMVDVLRNYSPAITWLKSLGSDPVILSGFVVMELYQGAGTKQNSKRWQKFSRIV